MRMPRLRTRGIILFSMLGVALFWFAGCGSTERQGSAGTKAGAQRPDGLDSPGGPDTKDAVRGAAEASLGKQSEVLADGDLARNGREQVLVVNRSSAGNTAEDAMTSAIFVTRAAVLEQDGGKWSEVLLCDEHLKNPFGYLGGSKAARVNGWRLQYRQDAKEGLEMQFTPAEKSDAVSENTDSSSGQKNPTFDVRWNRRENRYQTYDQSHERYLSEVPSLETPQSILR